MKAIVRFKDFPDHKGIPGHQGGSLPREELTLATVRKVNKAIVQYFKTKGNSYYQKVADINTGYCREWAYIIHEMTGAELWFNDAFSHAFVKYDGLFYDAETPNGVPDWIDVRGLRRQRNGLLNLRQHGIERSHPTDVTERGFAISFNKTAVDEITSLV